MRRESFSELPDNLPWTSLYRDLEGRRPVPEQAENGRFCKVSNRKREGGKT